MTAAPKPDLTVEESLTLAVIAASNVPILLLDGDLVIMAASDTFGSSYGLDIAEVIGRQFFELGVGEWSSRPLAALLAATAKGHADVDAYAMDLDQAGQPRRHLTVKAQRLAYGDSGNIRLLVTIVDLTAARQAEQQRETLLREREDLMAELQRRIANSLQVIASVLMLSARRIGSTETRQHLHDARNRVLSMAVLQENLAVTRSGDIELRTYFNDLCCSLAASMTSDDKPITLSVDADDSTASADVSVSLGLIVTELVINALKHAFPGTRSGTIGVAYRSETGDWTLGVRDDGIGMPADRSGIRVGLGTNIVEALARQLQARISYSAANPGSRVEVIHTRPRDNDDIIDRAA